MFRSIYIVLLCAVALQAQVSNGLAALQIGSSSRATAMAEAFTAVTQDVASPFWNPAGLARLPHRQLHLTHNQWIQDINHEAVCFAQPASWLNWGLSAVLTNVAGIEQRTIASEEPLGTFSAHTLAVGLTLAGKWRNNFCYGVNLRYLYEKIYVESASGFAVDLGVQYRTVLRGLTLGAVVQNVGSTTSLYREKIDLPETVRLGTAYSLPLGGGAAHALLAVDYVHVFDQDGYFNVGVEIWPMTVFALRTGYTANHSNRDWSMGFGLVIKSLLLDYAYVPFKQGLGNTHQFSVTFDL